MRHWYGIGGHWGSWLGWLVLVILVVALVYFIVKSLDSRSEYYKKAESSTSEALKILDERYARGEISEEEYLHRRDILKKDD